MHKNRCFIFLISVGLFMGWIAASAESVSGFQIDMPAQVSSYEMQPITITDIVRIVDGETSSVNLQGKKIVIVGGSKKARMDENGITYLGVIPFLLDEHSLEG